MPNPRPLKKSVSFQAHLAETKDQDQNDKPSKGTKSVFAVPWHLPLVLYGMFHNGLTAQPYTVMVKGFITLLLTQFVYGYVLARLGAQGKAKADSGVFSLALASTGLALVSSGVVFVAMILFGAPMYGFLKETYVLACHFSLFAVQPVLVHFRLDLQRLKQVFLSPNVYQIILGNQVLCGAFFAIIGTWLGVLPIPLDWDRPWQSWPITLLCGGYAGALVGSIAGFVL